MAKRNRTPSSPSGRARSVPVAVKKPFPWGTVLVSVVLGALLIAIIAYAAVNQGSGVRNLLKETDQSYQGLRVEEEPARDHVAAQVEYEGYPQRPPVGGEHNSVWQDCGVYEEEIPPEHAVHSLEHGAVWVTYSPDLPADQVEELRDLVDGDPKRLLSPLPGQDEPIYLSAWGRQLAVQSAEDDDVRSFLEDYTDGRQTPELGASCSGGVSLTGRTPLGGGSQPPAAQPPADDSSATPAPQPSATPSAGPTG